MIRNTLAVLLGSLALTSAIVCPRNICDNADCGDVTPENCNEQGMDFSANSTMCGCCNQCIKYLEEGESCCKEDKGYHLMGGPPSPKRGCGKGLVCNDCTCQKDS